MKFGIIVVAIASLLAQSIAATEVNNQPEVANIEADAAALPPSLRFPVPTNTTSTFKPAPETTVTTLITRTVTKHKGWNPFSKTKKPKASKTQVVTSTFTTTKTKSWANYFTHFPIGTKTQATSSTEEAVFSILPIETFEPATSIRDEVSSDVVTTTVAVDDC